MKEPQRPPRVLGRLRGAPGGPTVIVLAAVHGNEPAGVQAATRVLKEIERQRTALRGELVFLVGNRSALRYAKRFVDRDLNRQWGEERVAALRELDQAAAAAVEEREQWELLQEIEAILRQVAGSEIYFLDLHTSSAEGPPFLTVGDTLRNRRFAMRLPLPIILGLEEQVDGSLLEYLNDKGLITLGVEAGMHDSPSSIERHEAVLWLALVAAGVLRRGDLPDLTRHERLLAQARQSIPPVIEVRYRHAIRPEDQFQMLPGFSNFQPIRRGQHLARDRRGEVVAPEAGLILLPLYQGQGDDGYFVAREVRPFWLLVSAALRRLRMDVLMPALPGVRRHPHRRHVLVVNTRVARFYPLEIFHLFGFRKLRQVGGVLLVSRRRFDLSGPAEAP